MTIREPATAICKCGEKLIWWGAWAHNLPKFDRDHRGEPVEQEQEGAPA